MSAKKRLTRAERKQIEAAIARANRTDKKEKSAQDSIPYKRMMPDGICVVTDTYFTKTIQFQDINYQLSQNEDKTAIFEAWCDFLNYFDNKGEKEGLSMKLIFKILLFPIALILDLFTWVCIGLISCSSLLFRLASGIIAILGTAVLITYSVKNGLILLTIAFLFSPMGLPMLAVHLLGGLQSISGAIKTL